MAEARQTAGLSRPLFQRLALARATDPFNLAVARIIVFAVIAVRFDTASLIAIAELPSDLIRMPFGMGWAQGLVPTDPDGIRQLGWLVRISAVAAALGLATRASAWTATLSACLLFTIPSMFGHVNHLRQHLIWFGAILAASPCGDRLSLDRLLGRWRHGPQALPAPEGRYGFPFTAMLVAMGVAYFFAGWWKLMAGPAWFAGDNLIHLAAKLEYTGHGANAALVAAYPWLARLTSFGVIAFELGFVFLVLFRRGRVVALAAAFAFHLGTLLALGISFALLLYCYLGFVDWARLRRWVGRWCGRAPLAPLTAGAAAGGGPSPLQWTVAAIVIGANLTLGVLKIGSGWPFACYPRFDAVHTPQTTSYVMEGVTADGRIVRLHDAELGRPYGRYLHNVFRANQSRVPALEEVDHRLERWRRLCTFVWARHPALREAQEVRFILDDLDLSEGPHRPRRLGERPLFACEAPSWGHGRPRGH